MAPRAMPQLGRAVTVIDLDHRVDGIVAEVHEGGRRLLVETAEGERLEFVLRGATATFTAYPGSGWPRLVFD